MLTYQQALDRLGHRDEVKVANNTWLIRRGATLGGDIGVRLHATFVVLIHPDDTYTIASGGWRTPTTKDRINQYSPANLYQRNHSWYLGDPHQSGQQPYFDGMRIDSNGVRL